jgi:hypothetical protein
VAAIVITTALTASVTAAMVIFLIVWLAASEVAGASTKPALVAFRRYATIYSLPLLVAFAIAVVIEVVRIIG